MAKKNSKSEYYLGNPNLPNRYWKEEYTLEMVNDLKQCKEDLLYFAENFFYIIDPDKGKVKIELFEYQKKALNTLLNNRQVILLASRQIGKALALDTPIPIPTGWTTIGEIKDDDEVYGIDGKICKVSKAHDILINRPCYEVEFDNGEKIIADEEHLWFTQTRSERYLKISGTKKSTKQILKTLLTNSKTRQEPNHRIPANINGIETLNAQLPINPYILGLWLGDGTAATGTITVGTRDIEEIVDILSKQQQFDKLILHEYNKDVYTLRITNADNPKLNSLSTLLRNCDLINNKHIPEIYMRSSREQRIELLQGLIDSDGYISKQSGIAQFYNTNLILINHVRELIESLGYKVTQKTFIPKLKGVECTEVGVLTFTPIEYVCKLSFKTASIKCKEFINNTKLRSQWHYIKAITPIESVPVRCITVDNDTGTFLCGRQFIPTSNTTLLTIYALWIACFNEYQNIIIVANKESTAIEIFRRVRLAYEEMPNWSKPGVKEYGKTSLELENGSRIGISTTTGSAARGASINCVTGESRVTVRNRVTQVIEEITVAELNERMQGNNLLDTHLKK